MDQTGALGDVIVSANGQPVRRLSDLTDQLEAVGVGREIELSVKRSDRPMTDRERAEDIGRSEFRLAEMSCPAIQKRL
jgi:2-alkenal reductase